MAVVFTWAELAQLRNAGQAPLLTMFVTTSSAFARRMTWVGCLAIEHKAGEPMPVELLHGLDVILDLGNCERAAAVWRLMRQRNVVPSRCRAWCSCDQALTTCVMPCSDALEVDRYLTARETANLQVSA